MLIGFRQQNDKLEFVEGSAGPEQHCHSEPVRTTFVGISIEFQVVYRHTVCSGLPFSGIYPRKVVLLFWRLPRQESELARNDREFDGPSNTNLLHHRTIPSGSGKERPQTTFVTTCQRRLAAKSQFACLLLQTYMHIKNGGKTL